MLGVRGFSARIIWDRLPAIAWLTVIAAAALLAAKWLTVLVSPRPVAALASESPLPAPATLEHAQALFGKPELAAAPRIDGLELTGVYASGGHQGFATFNSPAGPLSVVVGDEVRPGLVLTGVEGKRVILRGNNTEWQLDLKSPPDLLGLSVRAVGGE